MADSLSLKRTIRIYFYIGLACIACIACGKQQVIDLNYSPDSKELFAEGVISTNLYERDLAISPTQNEIFYTLSDLNQTKRCLVHLTKTGNSWGNPKLFKYSGQHNDIEPFFHPNGNFLYFASDRPINTHDSIDDYNIWVSEKRNDTWTTPIALDSSINTDGDEFYPSISSNSNLYFTSTRMYGVGMEDIFLSKFKNNKYQTPQVLDTNINSGTYEFNAYISPDENLIVFSSYGRPDGFGGGDLYFSTKDASGNWSPATNFGEQVNSEKLDFCPFIDHNSNTLYFTNNLATKLEENITSIEQLISSSKRTTNGGGNIYRISLSATAIK